MLGNLVQAGRVQVAREGGSEIVAPAHFPARWTSCTWPSGRCSPSPPTLGVTPAEQLHFADRLLLFLSSCEKRRFAEYEQQSWWTFAGAEQRSPAYGKFLADGLTRTLVAAKAREISARTGGTILLQLLFDLSRPGAQADRVLNGPTNDVWIDPWLDHLRGLGVDYRTGHQVQSLPAAAGGSPAWG